MAPARKSRRPGLAPALLAAAAAAAWAVGGFAFVAGRRAPAGVGRGEALARQASLIQVPGGMKNGLKILIDDTPMQIMSFMSKKQGKGVGITKTKVKNLYTGAIIEKTLSSGAKFETIDTEWADATYSYYNEGSNSYMFMDTNTFEEIEVPSDVLGESAEWLADGMEVELESYNSKHITFRFREEIVLRVDEVIDSGRVDGDKQVILSNGLKKQGAGYLKVGDRVLISPTTFEISKRV